MSDNPFEEPKAAINLPPETAARAPMVAALMIIAADQISRQLSRQRLIQEGAENVLQQLTWAAWAAAAGTVLAAILLLRVPPRRVVLLGAAVLASGHLFAWLGGTENLAVVWFARPLIYISLSILVGRILISRPEPRDAWFTAFGLATNFGAFVATMLHFAVDLGTWWSLPQIGFALAIIPLVLLLIPRATPVAGPPPARSFSPPVFLGIGAAALICNNVAERLMLVNQGSGGPQTLVTTVLGTFLPIGLVVYYALSSSPGRSDRAHLKIAIGAGAAVFALIMALAGAFPFSGMVAAQSALGIVASELIVPVGFALAATLEKERHAIFAVSAWSLLQSLGMLLYSFI